MGRSNGFRHALHPPNICLGGRRLQRRRLWLLGIPLPVQALDLPMRCIERGGCACPQQTKAMETKNKARCAGREFHSKPLARISRDRNGSFEKKLDGSVRWVLRAASLHRGDGYHLIFPIDRSHTHACVCPPESPPMY